MINHSDCISESIHIGDQFAFSDQSDELHPECSFFHNAVCFFEISALGVSTPMLFLNPKFKFPNPGGAATFRIRRP